MINAVTSTCSITGIYQCMIPISHCVLANIVDKQHMSEHTHTGSSGDNVDGFF